MEMEICELCTLYRERDFYISIDRYDYYNNVTPKYEKLSKIIINKFRETITSDNLDLIKKLIRSFWKYDKNKNVVTSFRYTLFQELKSEIKLNIETDTVRCLFFDKCFRIYLDYRKCLDYTDYDFYKKLIELKFCKLELGVAFGEHFAIRNIKVTNELLFLIFHYKNCKDENKFLEYFEEVCSTTDFSDEYK